MYSESLTNYFMLPTDLNGLKIYPVKLMNYDRFVELFSIYFLLDIDDKNKLIYQNWEKDKTKQLNKIQQDNLFDFLIETIKTQQIIEEELKDKRDILKQLSQEQIKELSENEEFKVLVDIINNDSNNLLNEIIELLEIIFRTTVGFDGSQFVVGDYYLNKDNFYEVRKIVMKNNLIYKPLIAPDLRSQKSIDKKLKQRGKGGFKEELASIIAAIKIKSGVSDEELLNYTYFRARYDFKIIERMEHNVVFHVYENGTKEPLNKEINLYNENPYGDLFDVGNYKTFLDK